MAPQYIRKILEDFKKDINSNTLIIGDFNIPLSTIDRSYKQRINKGTVAFNNTLDQMDLIDTYRTFHPKEENCTFFSNAHGIFSKIDKMIRHKTSLNKLKIEITSSVCSNQNGLKLETNLKEKNSENIQMHGD